MIGSLSKTYDTINTDTKKPRGGQRMSWMKCLQKDLHKANITLNQALDVSQDRVAWRQIVHKMRWSRSNQDVWTEDICISQVSQVKNLLEISPIRYLGVDIKPHDIYLFTLYFHQLECYGVVCCWTEKRQLEQNIFSCKHEPKLYMRQLE